MADGSGTPPFDPGVVSGAPPSGGYATNSLSGTGATAAEPRIFMGWQHGYADDVRGSGSTPPRTKIELTPTQALAMFDHFDREDFLRLRNLLVAAGIVSPGADPATVRDAYAGLIGNVADMQAQGSHMSPLGFVKNLVRMNGIDPSEVGADADYDPSKEAEFSGAKTTVSKSVNDITEGQAWASLQGTLSQMLGRDPSDQETRDFTYRMGKLAASNPTISKTVTQYKDGEAVSSSTDTSGGFTADDVAQRAYDQAQAEPDYAEYRSASYYMNALMGALGPMGG